MNKEIEFINAVKELEVIKARINDYTSTVIFIWTSNIWRIGSDKYNEDIKNALSRGNEKELYEEMYKFEQSRPFLGNDIWHLYRQYLFFLLRLRSRVEMDFKRKKLSHWKNDLPHLKEILDEKYHPMLDVEHDGISLKPDAIHLLKDTIENEMVDKINEKFKEFSGDKHFAYSDFIIGSQNVKGDNNIVNNSSEHKITIKQFAKDHPIVTIITLLLSAFGIFLMLVQTNWIKV